MTKKLENASNNLREVLMWLADGEAAQYTYETIISDNTQWFDCTANDGESPYSELGLSCRWRKKPDVRQETIDKALEAIFDCSPVPAVLLRELGLVWDKAMEHKDND